MEPNTNIPKEKYFVRETGGIVKLVNDVIVYSLDQKGNWTPNQYLYSMFVDGTVEFEEITKQEVDEIILERKSKTLGGKSL